MACGIAVNKSGPTVVAKSKMSAMAGKNDFRIQITVDIRTTNLMEVEAGVMGTLRREGFVSFDTPVTIFGHD